MALTKREIRDAIAALEWAQFSHPDDERERARLNEIRALARDQLADDTYSTVRTGQRVGRSRVLGLDEYGLDNYGRGIWAPLTPEQVALEAGMAGFLKQLTGEQRVLYRMVYAARLTFREAAMAMNTTHWSVMRGLKRLHREMRALLVSAFAAEEAAAVAVAEVVPEVEDKPDPWAWPWDGHLPVVEEPAYLDEPRVPVARRPVGHLTFAGGA